MGAQLGHVALVHHHDLVGLHQGGDAVGDQDHSTVLHALPQTGADKDVGLRVHGGQGIVKDQNGRFAGQGAGDGRALLLTAGPGVLNLTYVQNSGAAFSSFEGQQWLFALIFLFFTGLIVWEYFKKKMAFTPFERWCIAAIYGGGFANMVDRLRMGYVVDMIETAFMDFPVFNVADCFITCGCVLLMGHLVLFNKAFWKDKKK